MSLVICSFLLLLFNLCSAQVTVSTVPSTVPGETAYIVANEGTFNITLECFVFDGQTQIVTTWGIQRKGIETQIEAISLDMNDVITAPTGIADDILITGSPAPGVQFSYRSNFTLFNFTREFDNTVVDCGSSMIRRTFVLGFPVLPSVANGSLTTVNEGSDLVVDLSMNEAPDPFPPTVSFLWTFEDSNISSSSNIIVNTYNITLVNIARNMSGTYSLTVSNSAGSSTGSFVLNVQFPPEAMLVDANLEPFLSGSSLSLVAFISSSIDGNPLPTVSWTGPDGLPRNTSGRFNTTVPGQIAITNIATTDNGTYTCTISNGIGQDLTQTIHLIIAVPAGAPQGLEAMNVTDTTAILSWSAPDNLGLPELSFYRLKVTPSPPSDVNLTTTSTSLLVYGILPNTIYNFTVVGISTGDNFDMLKGERSNEITFQTMIGAPEFMTVNVNPTNGTIKVTWTFRHIGGGSDIDLNIYCQIDDEGSGSRLSDSLSCDSNECVTDNLMGVATLGPVLAGETYSCSVSARNPIGTDRRMFNNVIITEGIPSMPIVSHEVFPGRVSLSLSVAFVGTTGSSFRFIVDIRDSSNNSIRVDMFSFPNLMNGQIVERDVVLSDGGTFTIIIRSRNMFGTSDEDVEIVGLVVEPGPTTTTTSTRTDTSTTTESNVASNTPTIGSNTSGISGGAIAGIIIAVIIILAIIAIVVFIVIYIVYQNRGGSYKVEKSGRVVVEEHDIDIGTELQSTKSGAVAEQEKKPFLATSSTTPAATASPDKGKLIYADLAEFSQPKTQTPTAASTAKPMPIEEVQYAVIRPQDQKPPTNPSSSAATSQ